jgi:hypothetical protein
VNDSLAARAYAAFARDLGTPPAVSLRGGNALDEYKYPEAFDPVLDAVSDAYLERYWWGVAHLDAPSWRHYLPHLIEYSLRRRRDHEMVIEALLTSLRPPDREPPRLASLSVEQESVVSAFLDVLAFDDASVHQELARTALEEWWAPGALYRRGGARADDTPDSRPDD